MSGYYSDSSSENELGWEVEAAAEVMVIWLNRQPRATAIMEDFEDAVYDRFGISEDELCQLIGYMDHHQMVWIWSCFEYPEDTEETEYISTSPRPDDEESDREETWW